MLIAWSDSHVPTSWHCFMQDVANANRSDVDQLRSNLHAFLFLFFELALVKVVPQVPCNAKSLPRSGEIPWHRWKGQQGGYHDTTWAMHKIVIKLAWDLWFKAIRKYVW